MLEILKYPDGRLKNKAEVVKGMDPSVKALMDEMIETMRYANGVGLAATQVGVSKRVVVVEVPEKEEGEKKRLFKLINPEIISSSGEIKEEEGCLSVPGVSAEVKRAENVVVRATAESGKTMEINATGLLAVVFQHEIDHLNGILFIDRLSRLKRQLILRRFKKLAAAL